MSELVKCYQEFSQHFHTEPNTKENRWLSNPFFNNPRIQFGNRRNKTCYTPELFDLDAKAELLTLGQLFKNQKPITKADLETLGYTTSEAKYKLLESHLKTVVGEGKIFDAAPIRVRLKYNRLKPVPPYLIDNIKDFMKSFKKGSAPLRKVFRDGHYKPITIDMTKFTGKINGSIVTMNQMKHCMRNLQLKFISNDYNDYKSRAIHGKILFNNSLSKFTTVEKWCKHCLSMGIRTIEDFEHATHTCPQVQYMLHKVKNTLGINCEITPSICVYSCPRPPDARRDVLVEFTLFDIIWTISLKITLKARSEGNNICINSGMIELQRQLNLILRNYPKTTIADKIMALDHNRKIAIETGQN